MNFDFDSYLEAREACVVSPGTPGALLIGGVLSVDRRCYEDVTAASGDRWTTWIDGVEYRIVAETGVCRQRAARSLPCAGGAGDPDQVLVSDFVAVSDGEVVEVFRYASPAEFDRGPWNPFSLLSHIDVQVTIACIPDLFCFGFGSQGRDAYYLTGEGLAFPGISIGIAAREYEARPCQSYSVGSKYYAQVNEHGSGEYLDWEIGVSAGLPGAAKWTYHGSGC